MHVSMIKPFFAEKVMNTRTVSHAATDVILVCMRNPNSVVAPRAEAPHANLLHVENALSSHPEKYTVPKAVGAVRVFCIGWTVTRPRDVDNDAAPTTLYELMGPLSIIRPMSI